MYLRIPKWCKSATIKVNGEVVTSARDSKGFVKLERAWSNGDILELSLPMEVTIERDKTTPVPDTYYFKKPERAIPITKVHNEGMPYASVQAGPLLFALPLAESESESSGTSKWNYALDSTTETLSAEDVTIVRNAMPTHFHWQLDSPLKLVVPAAEIRWEPSNTMPLPAKPVSADQSAKITLIPYGATKNRVAMFPVYH